MKMKEMLDREELPYNIGMVWTSVTPMGVEVYGGVLLKADYHESVSDHSGMYGIKMRITSAKGRKSEEYKPCNPGEILSLYFGPDADIEFYTEEREGRRLYRRGLKNLRKTFGRENVDKLKKFDKRNRVLCYI